MVASENISQLFDYAASQWGLITSAQALRIGVSRTQLNRMVTDGRLEPVSYGVYRAAMGDETSNATVKAAWLSLYPKLFAHERLNGSLDAVVTGRTAACVYGYGNLYESPYCFIVRKEKRSTRKDIELVHVPIDKRDVSRSFEIPLATPERAIADLVRLHEDPSLVDGVMADAAREGHIFDKERLSELLSPLAKNNGYPAKDGDSFASELIDRNATGIIAASLANRMAKAITASRGWEETVQQLARQVGKLAINPAPGEASANTIPHTAVRQIAESLPKDALAAAARMESVLQDQSFRNAVEYANRLNSPTIKQVSDAINSLRPFFEASELFSQLVKPFSGIPDQIIGNKPSSKKWEER